MSGVTVVLPSIDPETTRACLDTMHFVDPTHIPTQLDGFGTHPDVFDASGIDWVDGKPDVRLVVVYNTPQRNAGVAGSWNIGARAMYGHGHDWLVICSAGVRFGEQGGKDFLATLRGRSARGIITIPDVLEAEDQARLVEEWQRDRPRIIEAGNDLGWHLIAFHRSVLTKVGYFDENFWPAYSEDNDYSYRIQLAYGIDSRSPDFKGPLWPKVDVDASLDSVAHGILRGGVTVDFTALEDYYRSKWGAPSPYETFTRPFDDPKMAISGWPQPPDPRALLGKD